MDCREARLLISSCIDGMNSKHEDAALAEHVSGCDQCAGDLALYKRISAATREACRIEVQAPPELCGRVMSRLRSQQRRTAFTWLPVTWRKAAAAAAAVLLLAGGSAAVTAGLNMPGNWKMVVLGNDITNDENGLDTKSASGDIPSGQADKYILPGGPNTPDGGQKEHDPENVQENPALPETSVPDGGPEDASPNNGTINNTPPEAVSYLTREGPVVLLSNSLKVTSTVLKVAVEDLSGARDKAVIRAGGAGAAAKVFPEQNGSKKLVVIRLTVESVRVPSLIAELSGLGTVLDKQDENRDITSLYNETVVRYSDLQHRIRSTEDPEERRNLELQAASYKQQLDAWTNEAGKRVIMLWLESK